MAEPPFHVVTLQDAPVAPLTGIQVVASRLATYVLALMAVFGALLIAAMAVNEFIRPPQEVETMRLLIDHATQQYLATGSAETLKAANDLLGKMSDARKASRDWWLGLCQMLLLNLLLPVLTSILGYVFATQKSDG